MKMTKHPILVISLFVLCSCYCIAQIVPDITDIDREEFKRHRDQLRDSIDNGVIVLFGSYEREDSVRFRQNNHFYYFTGVEIPNAALVINKETGVDTLFLAPQNDEQTAKYDGQTLGPGELAGQVFGFSDNRPLAELETYLSQLKGTTIWTYQAPEEVISGMWQREVIFIRQSRDNLPWADYQTREEKVFDWLIKSFSEVQIEDITPTVNRLRSFKSEWEINRMRRAVDITENAFRAVLPYVQGGINEHQVEAVILKEFVNGGAYNVSYTTIVAGGNKSNILHYTDNNNYLKDGDLLLMDFGCDYQYYSTDISRTIPVNGRFTEEQRKYYEIVLDIQKKLIAMCKPGVTMIDISRENYRLAEEYGLAKNYYHPPTHYLGMSVHDVSKYDEPLDVGSVITIEPGLYFPDKGFGIRIEDDVLITKDGSEVLSKNIPKEVEDIERLMR